MSSILLLADHHAIAILGARLNAGAKECGDEIYAITPRLSAVFAGQRMGLKTAVLRRKFLPRDINDQYHDGTFEVKTRYMTNVDARRLHDAFVSNAYEMIAPHPSRWSLILVWNGGLVSGRAAETLSATFGIPVLYMEIPNIPGRMVFDPEGSNSDASVAKRPAILDRYPITDEVFHRWKEQYISARKNQLTLPQVKGFVRPNFAFAIDWLGMLLGATPSFSVGPLNRIKNIREKRKWERRLSIHVKEELPSEPYLFLPLQVSNDTNIVVRSTIDNAQAISLAVDMARENHWKVVAKVHPAEREGAFFRDLVKLLPRHQPILQLTSANTVECILRSTHVVTINSTAGFESRIMGKDATILQPAIYSKWTERHMAQFAMRYTIGFDRYGSKPATAEQWREIVSRAFPQ